MKKYNRKYIHFLGGQHCYCGYCVSKEEQKFGKLIRSRLKQQLVKEVKSHG